MSIKSLDEIDELVLTEVNEWWNKASIETTRPITFTDVIKKTIELKNKYYGQYFKDKIESRIEEIAMEKAKDINGIPIRASISRDITVALLDKYKDNWLKTEQELVNMSVEITDCLLDRLKK